MFGSSQLLVFRPGDRITVRARSDARFMMLGGEPIDGPRFHLVELRVLSGRTASSRRKPIGRPARFETVPGDNSEFIPLPEPPPPPVRYP